MKNESRERNHYSSEFSLFQRKFHWPCLLSYLNSKRPFLCFSSSGKGKPLQRKVKPPKKQEEKDKKGRGKPQEDELKDALADDDSSSTTTETSNPDTDPLLKEVRGWANMTMCPERPHALCSCPQRSTTVRVNVLIYPQNEFGSLLIK